ncbi:MAG: 2-C-methyl-D-erythritol 4-phosphate cytidylyltransferase [Phycisphaeraceae bacterium]|nr:2-C-methyl-D-erythritol 4-phosphate cytidylyltransferase [Phycisphaeraceae bacterium]
MNLAVIIPAAGSSRRYGEGAPLGGESGGRSKLDEDLGGRPVLHRTVELFTKIPEVSIIIVAGPADEEAFAQFRLRHADKLGLLGVRLCRGGRDHRYETVANALREIPDGAAGGCTHVAIHDAARPCASEELIERVLRAAERHGAAIPGVDVPDTLKRVSKDHLPEAPDPLAAILGSAGASAASVRAVEETVDRSGLVAVQTPQVFRIDLIRRAYAQADLSSTDDAQLVERLGERVVVVEGDPSNIKITRPRDLLLARLVLGVKGPAGREAHKRF